MPRTKRPHYDDQGLPPGRDAALFQDLWQGYPDAIVVVNQSGVVVLANNESERMFGWTREELLGQPVDTLIPEDLRHRHSGHMRNYFEHPHVRPMGLAMELYGRRRDGSQFPVEISLSPYRTKDELLVSCAIRDRTDRMQALSAIYESVSDALFLLSVEPGDRYRFLTVNRSYLRLTGLKAPQVEGRYVNDVIPPDALPQFLAHCRRAVASRADISWEHEITNSSETRFCEIRISPVFDNRSVCTSIVGAIRDLTEWKRSLLEKAHLEDQLLHSSKMESIGRLVSGVVHDFNNLLTVINGQCDLLVARLAADDPIRRRILEVRMAGGRAASLVGQLLTFSRKGPVDSRVLDLNGFVNETRGMLRRLLGEDIEMTVRLHPEPLPIRADRTQLTQVMMNLVANGRDAMPQGGVLRIQTSVLDRSAEPGTGPDDLPPGACAVLTVADSGVGIEESLQKQIFEPFFTTKAGGSGVGLGLSTVQSIVTQAGGTLRLLSQPGRGSEFRLYFPLLEDGIDFWYEKDSESELQRGNETILVVEDQAMLRETIREILSDCGYKVLTAVNGRDALAQAENLVNPVDLLLTDAVMPGMGGFELVRRLRLRWPDLKVLQMSGYSQESLARREKRSLAGHWLPKPFTPEQLAAKVREVIDSEARTERPSTAQK